MMTKSVLKNQKMPFGLILGCTIIVFMLYRHSALVIDTSHAAPAGKTENDESKRKIRPTKPVPPFKERTDLAQILNDEGLEVGVELGVKTGDFAQHNLNLWSTCKKYVLVDLWSRQDNYHDAANVDDSVQEQHKEQTLKNLEAFKEKYEICQDFTTVCAKRYDKETFDFIYVDARHDFKGVLLDLEAWYPLLKRGGIIAGHDYVTNDDGPLPLQDWSVNYDGTRDLEGRAVKGAVDDFAAKHNLQLTIAYRESSWNTWAARKPYSE